MSSQPLLTHGVDDLLPGDDHLHEGVLVSMQSHALTGQIHLARLVAGGCGCCLVLEHEGALDPGDLSVGYDRLCLCLIGLG